MELNNVCSCLDNSAQIEGTINENSQIQSTIDSARQITSNLKELNVVAVRYSGGETEDIKVNVDNTTRVITATLQQTQYTSKLNFPNIGSNNLIYIDMEENASYRWDAGDGKYIKIGSDSAELEAIKENVDALNSSVDDLQTQQEILSNALSQEITDRQTSDTQLSSQISDLRNDKADKTLVEGINLRVTTIEDKIPNQASSTNQLADKDFVNSSISTATATFRGTYNTLTELQTVSADLNDYGFVKTIDEEGNTVYNRYKYNGYEWVFEYALNNSSFTASQWTAINSGITAENVAQIGVNTENIASLETNKANIDDIPTTVEELTDGADYVKFTDYATQDKSGVVKVAPQSNMRNGIEILKDGLIRLSPISVAEFKKTRAYGYTCIAPNAFDGAVKEVLSHYNEIYGGAWTEEEQLSTKNLLGINDIKKIQPNENGEYVFHIFDLEEGFYDVPNGATIQYSPNGAKVLNNVPKALLQVGSKETNTYSTKVGFNIFGIGRLYMYGTESTLGYECTVTSIYWDTLISNMFVQTINKQWTFATQPLMTAELEAGDNSTKIPNTQWVQGKLEGYAKITDIPATLPNPNTLTIKQGGATKGTYDGSSAVEVDLDDTLLYNTIGQNTDGAMTQKATTDAIESIINNSTQIGTLDNETDSIYSFVAGGAETPERVGTIAIGGGAKTGQNSIAIGLKADAQPKDGTGWITGGGIAIGSHSKINYSSGWNSSVSIGDVAESTGSGVSIGYNAKGTARNAIQLGAGTNNNEKTLQVYEFTLLDGNTGKIPTERYDVPDTSSFITKDVDNLTNYELKANTGSTLDVSIDSSTYVMTMILKNSEGTVLSTEAVDLPLETMVVNATYADGVITLVLKNGTEVPVDVSAIVSGLVPDTRTVNGKQLNEDITLTAEDVEAYSRYNDCKAFAIMKQLNPTISPIYGPDYVSYWDCSKFSSLNVGDKIFVCCTNYHTTENDNDMESQWTYVSTITSKEDTGYSVSSAVLTHYVSGVRYPRLFAFRSELPTAEEKESWNNKADLDDIPDTSSFVTTDTNQNISGEKVFDSLKVRDNYWTEISGLEMSNTLNCSPRYATNDSIIVAIDFDSDGYSKNKFAYSTDGQKWINGTLPTAGSYHKLIYGRDKFLAYGWTSNTGIMSTDGINWTSFTSSNSAIQNARIIQYVQSLDKYLCFVGASTAYQSTDGINWTSFSIGTSDSCSSFSEGNNIFLLSDRSGKVLKSTNGINWEQVTMPETPDVIGFWELYYLNGVFVAFRNKETTETGISQYIAKSTDGTSWELTDNTANMPINMLNDSSSSRILNPYNNRLYYFPSPSNANYYWYSTMDGIMWDEEPDHPQRMTPKIIYNGNILGETDTYTGDGNSRIPVAYLNFINPTVLSQKELYQVLNKIPDNDGLVHKIGNETIDGYKTFSKDVLVGPSTRLQSDANGAMEFGRTDGTASTPYIDFHTDGSPSTDYNVRMLASGNQLNFVAGDGLYLNGKKIIAETTSGVVENSSVESGKNGYYKYWWKIYSDGSKQVYGVYYTSTDTTITIPFTDFAFDTIDYFCTMQGNADDGSYTDGAFVSGTRTTTSIKFDSRSKAQWYNFMLYEDATR